MSHIVVLEPNVRLAQTYSQALEAWGYSVAVCHSAQGAVSAADTHTPDLVMLELQLVAHSGIEFLYEFRSYYDWRQIPAMVVSNVPPGEFADSQQLLSRHLGVRAYHYKPRTSLQVLHHSLENILQPA